MRQRWTGPRTLAHPPYLPNTDSLAIIPPQPFPRESQSAKLSELRFRALLTEDGAERLEIAKV